MKDFGYYKNIINQKYNPEKKVLTKKEFYVLRNKIIDGEKEYADELFQLMCFHVYDIIAHAYVEKIFQVEFEDALQIASLLLYRMKIGDEKTIFGTNFFTEIPNGTSFKKFEYEIMSRVFKNLEIFEEQAYACQKPSAHESQKINELLQTPEDVAVAHFVRQDLKKIVVANGFGSSPERKEIAGNQTWSWICGKATLQELANEESPDDSLPKNRQKIYERCKSTLARVAAKQDENGIKELLY